MADDDGSTGKAGDPAGSEAPEGRDWTSDLTDRLDELIGKVRTQTTDRLLRLARIIVFGFVAVVVGLMAAILAVVALVRLADVLIPQEVWLAYLVLGGLFSGVGAFLWSKRDQRTAA